MYIPWYTIFRVAQYFLKAVSAAIALYCVLSWFMSRESGIMRWLDAFIRPFVAPFRALWYGITRGRSPIDLSCWFAVIGIWVVQWLLMRLYYLIFRVLL